MKSLEELKAIRDRVRSSVDLRENNSDKIRVVVGMATCGIAAGARRLHNARFKLCNDFRIRNEHKPLILCVHCRRCTERGIPKQRNLLLGKFFVRVGANAAAFKHRFDNIVYMCL